jgi:putative membrane protein
MLSKAQRQILREAVTKAERETTGEIFCVVAHESARYREIPFAWAGIAALAAPPLALALGLKPELLAAVMQNAWTTAHDMTAVLSGYAALQAALFVIVALIASLRPIKMLLTPASLKREHVHQRAMEQFFAQGLQATTDRTGVLIYLSAAERRVEIIADEAIHAKVGAETWDRAVKAALAHLRGGDVAAGLQAAIEVCGAVLGEHFPFHGEKINQLSDDVVEL